MPPPRRPAAPPLKLLLVAAALCELCGDAAAVACGTLRCRTVPALQQAAPQHSSRPDARTLQQGSAPQQESPPPAPPGADPALLDALLGIQSEFVDAAVPATNGTPPAGGASTAALAANGTAAATGGASPSAPSPGSAQPSPAPCTDPSLLTQTMSTFCQLSTLEALAALPQDAVQACCRLTSATLQAGCWDACDPPPAVSTQVLEVLKLWRNICLVSARVTCEEGASPAAAPVLAAAAPPTPSG